MGNTLEESDALSQTDWGIHDKWLGNQIPDGEFPMGNFTTVHVQFTVWN